eukprot:TRINITY_DN10559_c0_g1_i15.p1 TRINITY_DN10559_c0_g1~~TRINITY_DN10559_c0_g1_i15.p1  ORF type:complete len:251 (+),score=48.22 TRINITY_DN10559_c0_g1_i15:246-998(+)
MVHQILIGSRSLLLLAHRYKKPADADLTNLCGVPLQLAASLVEFKPNKKGRCYALHQLLAAATPALSCIFSSDCGAQLLTSRRAVEDISFSISKTKGNTTAFVSFVDAIDGLLRAIEGFVEEKHYKVGLVWSGLVDVPPALQLNCSIWGHQALLSLSRAPSKLAGKSFLKDNKWYCQFWCAERGPVTIDSKDRECEIFGCTSSEIQVLGKPTNVKIGIILSPTKHHSTSPGHKLPIAVSGNHPKHVSTPL